MSKKPNTKKVEKVEKEEVKEVEEKEEKTTSKEEFYDEKPKKEKSLFQRVMNVILWVVLFVWMGICLVDFFNTRNLKDPVFCLKKETTTYSDGTVDSCTGLGYKIYRYKRASYNGVEYGPFWAKDRSAENK